MQNKLVIYLDQDIKIQYFYVIGKIDYIKLQYTLCFAYKLYKIEKYKNTQT